MRLSCGLRHLALESAGLTAGHVVGTEPQPGLRGLQARLCSGPECIHENAVSECNQTAA
jgi:hypothetical protein